MTETTANRSVHFVDDRRANKRPIILEDSLTSPKQSITRRVIEKNFKGKSPDKEHETQPNKVRSNFLKNRQTRSLYTQNTPGKTSIGASKRTPAKEEEDTLLRTSFGHRRKTEMPINTSHPLNLLTKEVQMRQAQIEEFTKLSNSQTTAEWLESEMYAKVGPKLGDQLSVLQNIKFDGLQKYQVARAL